MQGKPRNLDPRQPFTIDENGKIIEAKPKYNYDEEMENAEVIDDEYYMTLGD
jgi:hypothetical protein